MTAIGGRTMWYCSCCGQALSVGRGICSCGGKTIPDGAMAYIGASEGDGLFARVRHKMADVLGWRNGPR